MARWCPGQQVSHLPGDCEGWSIQAPREGASDGSASPAVAGTSDWQATLGRAAVEAVYVSTQHSPAHERPPRAAEAAVSRLRTGSRCDATWYNRATANPDSRHNALCPAGGSLVIVQPLAALPHAVALARERGDTPVQAVEFAACLSTWFRCCKSGLRQ